MRNYNLELFADYHQFYIQDESAEGNLSDSWNKEAEEKLLAITEGTIGIGTFSNGDVLVNLVLLDKKSDISKDEILYWDKINECTIEVKSNKLVIAGCTDYFPEAQRVDVIAGFITARIYYKEIPEEYKILIWSSKQNSEIKIIK